LIAERGSSERDYVWMGDIPVAVIDSDKGNALHYIHADHLGTPRALVNDTRETVWAWKLADDPFGEHALSTQSATFNLRFPGQYFDAETGLHYNMRRYYDARVGRYITSDPLGLVAGLNTFAYVGSSPLFATDPLGLDAQFGVTLSGTIFAILGGGSCSVTAGITSDGTWRGTSFFSSEQVNPMAGLGLYAGLGLTPYLGHTDGSLQSGGPSRWTPYVEANIGHGISGSFSSNFSFQGDWSVGGSYPVGLGKIVPGAGMGVMVGVGASKSWTQVYPSFGSLFGWSKDSVNALCK
jgi:RHS repeat-associated protein